MALKKKTASKAPLAKPKVATSKKIVKPTNRSGKKIAAKLPATKAKKNTVKAKPVVKAKGKIVLKSVAKHSVTAKKIISKAKLTAKKVVKKVASKIRSTGSVTTSATVRKGAKISSKKNVAKKVGVAKKVAATKSKKNIKVIAKPTISRPTATKKAGIVKKQLVKVVVKKVIKPISKLVIKPVVVKPVKEKKVKEKVAKIKPTPIVNGTEKLVKIGVKTKKQLIAIEPMPVVEVSNFPKHKIKTLLISQPRPENDKNPYYDLSKKYNLNETFRQFIKIEGLPVKDFRVQRIDILEHKAVILTSRMAVDHYFRMCNEMRVTVPESMKYFCINEATAYYLQKYIQYRKRKIFFGHQTIQDLVDVIKKNREEKFLLPAADVQKEKICEFLDALNIKYTKAVMYRTVSADLSDIKNLNDFDVLVFFTPAGIRSLKQNFPNFKQGNTRIACFGVATANTLKNSGYRLDIYAPNPKNPSMSSALEEYIKESNKR